MIRKLSMSLVVAALSAFAMLAAVEASRDAYAGPGLVLWQASAPVVAAGSAVTIEPMTPVTVNAGSGSTVVVTPTPLPDPAADPAESASLVWKLYKTGHLVPALIVLAFFLLMLAQRWVTWLKTGYRKLAVAALLAGLGMIAERAAAGTSPTLPMLMGAIGVAFALYIKGEGEPKPAT